jgi:hypothetical protein
MAAGRLGSAWKSAFPELNKVDKAYSKPNHKRENAVAEPKDDPKSSSW